MLGFIQCNKYKTHPSVTSFKAATCLLSLSVTFCLLATADILSTILCTSSVSVLDPPNFIEFTKTCPITEKNK